MLKSFQTAPADSAYRCGSCGNILNLKKGQILPPCPRCGFREFQQTTDQGTCC